MSFGGLILTNNGRNEIAKAETGEVFNITALCFGDGFYTGSFIQKNELTNTIMTLPVSNVVRDEDKVIVECDFSSKDAPEAFYLREIGIIANDKLCYYDNAQNDAEYINPDSEVYIKQRRMRFILLISSDVNVTVHLNNNLYALKDELDKQISDFSAHKNNDTIHITTVERTVWNNKVDKVSGMGLSSNNYTDEEKTKLSGIEAGANNYTHPPTHPATMIVEDITHRFVTDAEKNEWNNILQTTKDYADATYQQSTGYTDTKIAALINGAPSTLDTLKEIADAMEENQQVVDALDSAIGTKASEIEFAAHQNNNVVHITEDERISWSNALANAKKYANDNFLPLDGGTLENDILGVLKIKRNSNMYAAIAFENSNGVLGHIGMVSEGNLYRISKNGTALFKILDENNYKSIIIPENIEAAKAEHTHPATDIEDTLLRCVEVETSVTLKVPATKTTDTASYYSATCEHIVKAENCSAVAFLPKMFSTSSNDCIYRTGSSTGITHSINNIVGENYIHVTFTNKSSSIMVVEFASNSGITVVSTS